MKVKDILAMDGRKRAPLPELPWPRPHPNIRGISVTSVKHTIAAFEKSGQTVHSGTGSTLGYIVAYCVENNIPFTLKAAANDGRICGYYIEKVEAND